MKHFRILCYNLLGRYCPNFLSPYRQGWLFKNKVSSRDLEKCLKPWFFKPPTLYSEFIQGDIVKSCENWSEQLNNIPMPFHQHIIDTGQVKDTTSETVRWRVYGEPHKFKIDKIDEK